jgi:hypothetical protein
VRDVVVVISWPGLAWKLGIRLGFWWLGPEKVEAWATSYGLCEPLASRGLALDSFSLAQPTIHSLYVSLAQPTSHGLGLYVRPKCQTQPVTTFDCETHAAMRDTRYE